MSYKYVNPAQASLIPGSQRYPSYGYTLFELIITLAIITIVLAPGIPQFSDFLKKTRLTLASNTMHAAINLTRSEAIKRNCRVDLAPSDGRYWEKGWAIFIDNNNNQRPDEGDTLINTHEALHSDIIITTSFTDTTKHYIAYNGSGRTQTNAGSQQVQAGTISLTLNDYVHRIHIDFLGRARMS